MKKQDLFYRTVVHPKDLIPFHVEEEESNLLILAEKDLTGQARTELLRQRDLLKQYICQHPEFYYSFSPVVITDGPEVVKRMAEAAWLTDTGPMASVAGTLAEMVGSYLLKESENVIVENGGDIFLRCQKTTVIAIYAKDSPFSLKIGLKLPGADFSRGLATSSGTVGHSWSFGQADAVTVLCRSASLADAAATYLGNLVHSKDDFPAVEDKLKTLPFIEGVVIIAGKEMLVWGNIELVSL